MTCTSNPDSWWGGAKLGRFLVKGLDCAFKWDLVSNTKIGIIIIIFLTGVHRGTGKWYFRNEIKIPHINTCLKTKPTKSVANIWQQYSPINTQATERQTMVQNYKTFSKFREFYLDFFMLQSMMGNLKGLAKYLPKYSRAMVHGFPTIMLRTGPWHLSSQPADFFFSVLTLENIPSAIPPCPQIFPTTLVPPVEPMSLNIS